MAYKPRIKRERTRLPAFRNMNFNAGVNVSTDEEFVTILQVFRVNGSIMVLLEDASSSDGPVMFPFEDLGWNHYDLVYEQLERYGHHEWCLVPRYKP